MRGGRWDELLDRDWSETWNALPEAPELVPRAKTAQITLRVPASLVDRMKRVASAHSLPYHALARSWIVDAIREALATDAPYSDEPQTQQLNIKLDQDVLDELKARAHELRRPYHRLARGWIETRLAREEEALGLDPAARRQPAIKDLIVLLLHATNKRGEQGVRGITQLQKLLFVIEQKLASDTSFYALNYGPFNEQVNDAARALQLAGFLKGTTPVSAGPPSFEQMAATMRARSGPRTERDEEFALNEEGHEAAERLRASSRAYDQLFAYVSKLREEWDTPDLLDRVYEIWPQYAQRSLIRDEVAKRARRRGRR